MNTDTFQGTATIYQFPVLARRAVADRQRSAEAAVEAMSQRILDALDNCWYHDTAVRQATDATKL
jgi:hypothetical protein